MRESFGGAFMLKLAIVFIVVYVSFMAVAVNYAKAFRVKNQVINIIEQYQYNGETSDTNPAIKEINRYLASVPYNFGSNTEVKKTCENIAGEGNEYIFTRTGACIIPKGTMGKFGNSTRYYKVVTFIDIDFNFFDIHLTVPISGETKVIYINQKN